jgi:hypothetical protein
MIDLVHHDLIGRGFLTVSNDQGDLLVSLARARPGAPGLTDYERQVLGRGLPLTARSRSATRCG